LYLWWICY